MIPDNRTEAPASLDNSIEIGRRLREERSRLCLSQEDVAQVGGVNRNTQGSYERGSRNPDSAYLYAVAQLGIEVNFVITGKRALDTDFSDEEVLVVERFRQIPAEDQRVLLRVLNAMFDTAVE